MVRGIGVIVLGSLSYTAILFVTHRLRGTRAVAAASAFALIAGLYWTGMAFFLLGVTVGDARDGASPDRSAQRGILIATLVLAPLLFALMLRGWGRLVCSGRRDLNDA